MKTHAGNIENNCVSSCTNGKRNTTKLGGLNIVMGSFVVVLVSFLAASTSVFLVLAQKDATSVVDRRSNLFLSERECLAIDWRNVTDEDDLVPMEYTIFNEDGSEEKGMTLVYKRPHISTYYNSSDASMHAKKPKFVGFAGKFFNLSPWTMELVWDGGSADKQVPMATVRPFQAHGMGTFPNHKFYFKRKHKKRVDIPAKSDEIMKRFAADPNNPLSFYDAMADGHFDPKELSAKERKLYYGQLTNLGFAKKYKAFTGSEWLAMFPKARPTKKMWRADYFGQHHSIVTKETQFVSPPPSRLLSAISYNDMKASDVVSERVCLFHSLNDFSIMAQCVVAHT